MVRKYAEVPQSRDEQTFARRCLRGVFDQDPTADSLGAPAQSA
jgi:hypothetical protein